MASTFDQCERPQMPTKKIFGVFTPIGEGVFFAISGQ
jgi:hypothetical protein